MYFTINFENSPYKKGIMGILAVSKKFLYNDS